MGLVGRFVVAFVSISTKVEIEWVLLGSGKTSISGLSTKVEIEWVLLGTKKEQYLRHLQK